MHVAERAREITTYMRMDGSAAKDGVGCLVRASEQHMDLQ
jgi:hypothetical protein